jgi:hypothetical protein
MYEFPSVKSTDKQKDIHVLPQMHCADRDGKECCTWKKPYFRRGTELYALFVTDENRS